MHVPLPRHSPAFPTTATHTACRLAGVLVLALLAGSQPLAAQSKPAPAEAAGMQRTPILDNAAVTVTRIRFAPGARETPHTHPFTLLVVSLEPGVLDFMNGKAHESALVDPGHVELVPRGVSHAAANIGSTPWDVMAVAVKGRGPLMSKAGTPAPAAEGVDARATLMVYAPLQPATPQTTKTDAIVIPLTSERLYVSVGNDTTVKRYGPGEAIFLPKGVAHEVRNVGSEPLSAVWVDVP
jgi:quercetin dioxygenase-like cupin family protein